jgi:hypothetical protein
MVIPEDLIGNLVFKTISPIEASGITVKLMVS